MVRRALTKAKDQSKEAGVSASWRMVLPGESRKWVLSIEGGWAQNGGPHGRGLSRMPGSKGEVL